MDLCTGPLARASRLSADALTCGWPHGQLYELPTRPPTGRRLYTSSTALHHDRPNWARTEFKTLALHSGLGNPPRTNFGGASPAQHDTIHTIFPAQHSIDSESVTLPKSPVTFAEMRNRTSAWLGPDGCGDERGIVISEGHGRAPGEIGACAASQRPSSASRWTAAANCLPLLSPAPIDASAASCRTTSVRAHEAAPAACRPPLVGRSRRQPGTVREMEGFLAQRISLPSDPLPTQRRFRPLPSC
jgi:hypothetical protein